MSEEIPPENPEIPDESAQELPVQQISKRKVIYIELDEEITSVFERIERLNYKDVYLVVPERAVLLQSIVNLQILKKKVEGKGKRMALITKDPIGIKLAHKAEIAVYDQLEMPRPEPVKEEPAEFSQQPIRATSNEIEESRPERLTQKKLSIFEIVKEMKGKQSFALNKLKNFWKLRKEKDLFKDPPKFAMGAPSRKTLGTLIVASLCILLIISYIALPGATVTVTPEFNVIEQSVNITLADATIYGTNPSIGTGHTMAYYPIDLTLTQSLQYTSTGQIFTGTNASGYATLINERSTAWPLVAFTRLQTDDGLIFRVQEATTVPAANTAGPGSAEVYIVADEVDVYGRVMGDRGNIGPSSFVLPGLREQSQKELYARSSVAMTGGTTQVTLKVSEEDLNASESLMIAELGLDAEPELEAEVTRRNELNGTNLDLLTGYGAIEMDEPVVNAPTHLVESIQDSFEVTGRMAVYGVAFNHDEFLNTLEEELITRKSPNKELIKIDESSISYEIFEVDETPGQIKLTATIKGIEAYAIDPETESGAKLVKKIKEHIAGKPIKEGEDYVQNLSEINKVKISAWPVWAPTIPTVLENITIKVDEEWLESFE